MASVAAPAQPPALMRPRQEPHAFTDPRWEFSFARRGHRVLATLGPGRCTLSTARGCDLAPGLPELAEALLQLGSAGTVLDGQVSALQPPPEAAGSRPIHMRGAWPGAAAGPVTCWLQDVIAFEGADVRALPWHRRRELLRSIRLPSPTGPLQLMRTVPALGNWLFDQAATLGLPGIHAHRRQAAYHPGLSADWLLIPCVGKALPG